MSIARQDSGRVNQKRRTELALISATQELMRAGRRPTVAEAAEAALVSKATAYRYFPSQDSLLLEASKVSLPPPPADFGDGLEVVDRVEAATELILGFLSENERYIRTVIRASIDRWLDGEDPGVLRRGYRVPWLQAALEPLRGELDDATYERLLQALLILTSPEAMMVLTDVMGMSPSQAGETLRWAARTLTGSAGGSAAPLAPR